MTQVDAECNKMLWWKEEKGEAKFTTPVFLRGFFGSVQIMRHVYRDRVKSMSDTNCLTIYTSNGFYLLPVSSSPLFQEPHIRKGQPWREWYKPQSMSPRFRFLFCTCFAMIEFSISTPVSSPPMCTQFTKKRKNNYFMRSPKR